MVLSLMRDYARLFFEDGPRKRSCRQIPDAHSLQIVSGAARGM